jgi:hypothetical protein
VSEPVEAKVAVLRDDNGQFVHFGVVSDGAFHAFSSQRTGDYDEAVQAAEVAAAESADKSKK